MAEIEALNGHFHMPGRDSLSEDIALELQSAMKLHALSAEDLFYKWDSYCIARGSENVQLDFDTVRAFKKDIQEALERQARGKGRIKGPEKKTVHATPRAGADEDMFGMMGISTSTPRIGSVTKRKAQYEPSSAIKAVKSNENSSPTGGRNKDGASSGVAGVPFAERKNAGQIVETLNNHLDSFQAPIAPPAESRVKLIARSEIKKFAYRPLAMHLSEASEILDIRIEEFVTIIQDHHKLEDSAFGNAASKSTNEIVAVGRIASDTHEGKPNLDTLVLEMSRRRGAGRRVPLKFAPGAAGEFFPGQIVALQGKNSSGEYFLVSEVLEIPLLDGAASTAGAIEATNEALGVETGEDPTPNSALNIIVSSGPYTSDDNLDFEPLHALCEKARDTSADAVIMIGPFLDVEHPLIASGEFELPDDGKIEPDQATLNDAFRILISGPLNNLAQALPSTTIIMVPSVRDAVNKHMSWPQQNFIRKELGLPKQARTMSNPVTFSLNETMIGLSAADILNDLRLEEVTVGKTKSEDLLSRLPRHVIQQRHFFPMYPPIKRNQLPKAGTEEGLATGTPMDMSYLKLAEWMNMQPDVLILPSALPPFAKVVEGVVAINPGSLSKRRGPGTYSQITLHPRKLSEAESSAPDEFVGHEIYKRARVDAMRI